MEAPQFPSYIRAARAILAAAGKVQEVVQKPPGITHNCTNEQAAIILYNDGFIRESRILQHYMESLNRGVMWADKAWKNSCHFFNPDTNQGIWKWPNAVLECKLHYSRAVKYARSGNHAKAMFYLGAAVHLLQDLCVPHHAQGILFDGHQEFEDWAEENCRNFLLEEGGIYQQDIDPGSWVIDNAKFSSSHFALVSLNSSQKDLELATEILFKWCQRTTAGFLYSFCKEYI